MTRKGETHVFAADKAGFTTPTPWVVFAAVGALLTGLLWRIGRRKNKTKRETPARWYTERAFGL